MEHEGEKACCVFGGTAWSGRFILVIDPAGNGDRPECDRSPAPDAAPMGVSGGVDSSVSDDGDSQFFGVAQSGAGCTAGAPLELYGLQLAAGLLWTVIFFSGRRYALAFFWLALYWLLAFFTALSFAKRSRAAGWLMAPYLLWLTFAGYLNFAVWRMN